MKLAAAIDIYVLHRRAQVRSSRAKPLHSARSFVVTATGPSERSPLGR